LRICVDTTILLDILKDEFRIFQDKQYTALAAATPCAPVSSILSDFKNVFFDRIDPAMR
jgi:hypothetical protein